MDGIMSIKQIDTRVIDDNEYWKMFLRFNKNEAKKVFENAFIIQNENEEAYDNIIQWCRSNTSGLIYVNKKTTSMNLHAFGITTPLEARFYFADKNDALLFKLSWC